MSLQITEPWKDYELLDSGNGLRLEQFAGRTIVRPDPQVLWEPTLPDSALWQAPDLRYVGRGGTESWQGEIELLAGWKLAWGKAVFRVKPTPFRHMGLFPEQASQWQWVKDLVETRVALGQQPRVLNLFAYTGAASIVAAQAGAKVCHVDAAPGSVNWAKENARHSGLPQDAIRWIVEDVLKFMAREVRRGQQYDLLLMDPPVFGRGPKGEIWRLEKQMAELVDLASKLLSEDALGVLINLYATTIYPLSFQRVCLPIERRIGHPLKNGNLVLRDSASKMLLPTGFWIRS